MDYNPTSAKNRAKKRFSSSRYIFSKAGVPKILAIVIFLVSGILYLTTSQSQCAASSLGSYKALDLVFPLLSVVSAGISAFVYAIFAIGCAKRFLKTWVRLDVTLCTVFAIANLVVAVFVLTQCPAANSAQGVPAPLSLIASALLVICAAATYYMWRNRPEEPESRGQSGAAVTTWRIPGVARGSIFNLEVERDAFEL
ncbi:uncharacterized protein LOC124169077 [Ischnura elegans]|uniref:uncharacterized protein LOC124169077 n=1 Tax=Ischnura elegans TaxID=197161 RepID=UPI001ED8930C|nr:uncharacterized protein LOC124169077 [Ischnura elegans]